MMKSLNIEGVRSFRESQEIPIRPVTLLVGENSTGKSTVLAMVRAGWDIAFGAKEPDFSEEPFDLGGFDAIAHYHGGRAKRVHEFRIRSAFTEMRSRNTRGGLERIVEGTFTERAGQPLLTAWNIIQGNQSLNISSDSGGHCILTAKRDGVTLFDQEKFELPRGTTLHVGAFRPIQQIVFSTTDAGGKIRPNKESLDLLHLLPSASYSHEPRPIASAPIRTKPVRTYNPRREVQEPEGSHVPMELAALHGTNRDEFDALVKQISEYGRAANLFSKLDVKRLGKKAGDPFQVLITVDKFTFNVRDVGYGVSQILPILVDTLSAPVGQTFLLQQPEVHLHPRAQAALGSLLVEQASKRRQTFVVETHSDYLVDRVRMDVREGRSSLRPQDVVILYFEREAGKTIVYPVEIDANGNLINVPNGYRRFFLEEERRMLGM